MARATRNVNRTDETLTTALIARETPSIEMRTALIGREMPPIEMRTALFVREMPSIEMRTALIVREMPSIEMRTALIGRENARFLWDTRFHAFATEPGRNLNTETRRAVRIDEGSKCLADLRCVGRRSPNANGARLDSAASLAK